LDTPLYAIASSLAVSGLAATAVTRAVGACHHRICMGAVGRCSYAAHAYSVVSYCSCSRPRQRWPGTCTIEHIPQLSDSVNSRCVPRYLL